MSTTQDEVAPNLSSGLPTIATQTNRNSHHAFYAVTASEVRIRAAQCWKENRQRPQSKQPYYLPPLLSEGNRPNSIRSLPILPSQQSSTNSIMPRFDLHHPHIPGHTRTMSERSCACRDCRREQNGLQSGKGSQSRRRCRQIYVWDHVDQEKQRMKKWHCGHTLLGGDNTRILRACETTDLERVKRRQRKSSLLGMLDRPMNVTALCITPTPWLPISRNFSQSRAVFPTIKTHHGPNLLEATTPKLQQEAHRDADHFSADRQIPERDLQQSPTKTNLKVQEKVNQESLERDHRNHTPEKLDTEENADHELNKESKGDLCFEEGKETMGNMLRSTNNSSKIMDNYNDDDGGEKCVDHIEDDGDADDTEKNSFLSHDISKQFSRSSQYTTSSIELIFLNEENGEEYNGYDGDSFNDPDNDCGNGNGTDNCSDDGDDNYGSDDGDGNGDDNCSDDGDGDDGDDNCSDGDCNGDGGGDGNGDGDDGDDNCSDGDGDVDGDGGGDGDAGDDGDCDDDGDDDDNEDGDDNCSVECGDDGDDGDGSDGGDGDEDDGSDGGDGDEDDGSDGEDGDEDDGSDGGDGDEDYGSDGGDGNERG